MAAVVWVEVAAVVAAETAAVRLLCAVLEAPLALDALEAFAALKENALEPLQLPDVLLAADVVPLLLP